MSATLLLGLGVPEGDGAAGLAVVRRLRRRRLPGVVVAESGAEVSALLDAFQGRERVFLVDSAVSGRPAGTVRRVEASRDGWLAPPGGAVHALGIGEALELARSLGQLSARVVVYIIEERTAWPGPGLSQEVEQAVRVVEERLAAELQQLDALPAVRKAS